MIPNVDLWNDYRRNGEVFIVSHRVHTMVVNGISDVLIRVPENSNMIALIQAEVNDYMDFYMYENPTLNNTGHQLIPRNMNRAHSDEIDAQFSHSPDMSDTGTLIFQEFGLAWFGYFNEGTAIWELKKGTDYLLRIINISDDVSYLTWRLVFRKVSED